MHEAGARTEESMRSRVLGPVSTEEGLGMSTDCGMGVAGVEDVGQPILRGTWGTEKPQWVSGSNNMDPGFQKEPDLSVERKKTRILNLDKTVEQPVYWE